MKKLVTVINKDLISSLENEDITLLYPLKDFCVGYEEVFAIEDINDFCLVNRILDDFDLDKLEVILHSSNIRGIVFDDLGILDIIKDLNITKILLLDHLATNVRSINYYLDYVDSIVVSNDLTQEEIKNILDNAKKNLVVNVFGAKTLMYSRRNLISNYQDYHKLDKTPKMDASINDKHFKIVENEYGTKFYAYPYYDARVLSNYNNISYIWYDPIFLSNNDIINLVLNDILGNYPVSRIFLDKETVYKVGDLS